MSPFFLTFLLMVGAFILIDIIRPKPKMEDARPAGLGDFSFPTATEGRCIALIWGQVEIKGPNVIWFGNFRQTPITQKMKTGLFSSDTVTTGYRYYVGMDMAICLGPVDKLISVKIQDRILALGRDGTGAVTINAPEAMGGEEFGQGGIASACTFYSGTDAEVVNTYLDAQIADPVPAYRGVCRLVFEGGYIGTSVSVPAFSFVVERIPDGLNLAAYSPGAERVNLYDANPMNVAYEIFTNADWGLHIPSSSVNILDFQAAAVVLKAEGNGFSMVLDREIEALELLREIERQIDGQFYFDKPTGQWKIMLAREDYDLADLPSFDDSNTVELMNFARATWEETANQVNIKFSNRAENFRESYAMAQDMGNYQIQGGVIASEITYPGVKNATLANKLAWRDLRTLSYPLAKAELVLNRDAYLLLPSSPFKWSNARLGITDMVLRVTRLDYGNLANGKIRVSCVQDIFAVTAGTFADPPSSGWVDPVDDPGVLAADDILVFEAPFQLVNQDIWRSDLHKRLWMGARNPGNGTTALEVYYRTGSSRPLTGDFVSDGTIPVFCLAGSLATDIPAYYATDSRPASANVDIVNNDPDDLTDLERRQSTTDVTDLLTILYIDGEFIGYEEAAIVGSNLRVSHLYRGLFHTAPKKHAAGVPVWLIGQSGGNLTQFTFPSADDEADIRLYGKNRRGLYTAITPVTTEITMHDIAKVPLAPRDPTINSTYAPASVSLDTNYATETGLSGDNNRAVEVAIVPRNWHWAPVIGDTLLTAEWMAEVPTFVFSLVLGSVETAGVTVASDATPTAYLLRNAVIEALGANVEIPATAQLKVIASHTYESVVYTNPVPLLHDFALTSALQGSELIFGGFAVSTPSDAVVFGETGNYTFDIHTALPSSGIVEVSVNSGAWATLIAAAATTGILAVTLGDSIQLRFSVAPASDRFFDIVGPTETGYGVLLS